MDGGDNPIWQGAQARSEKERQVLSTIQAAGQISSGEIARQTGLSAQYASVLTRTLESEGLLRKGDPRKGKVGKPQMPMSLNPEGVFSFGLKIGRRRSDLVLLDFIGGVRGSQSISHDYPTPAATMEFLKAGIDKISAGMSEAQLSRLCGIGVAAPFELWNWLDFVDAPIAEMADWRDFSFVDAIAEFSDLPVLQANDATMACSAEQVFGVGRQLQNFAYFYVGTFIGGGLVLDGKIWPGPTGNAGAFGSIPVGDVGAPNHQLIHNASLFGLERRLLEAGLSVESLRETVGQDPASRPLVEEWLQSSAQNIAAAAIAVVAVVDVATVVVDSALPRDITGRLAELVGKALNNVDRQGVATPEIRVGKIGSPAGAMGGAYLPIASRLLVGGTYLGG